MQAEHDHAGYDQRGAKEARERCGIAEEQDADQEGPGCPDAGPNSISGADRNFLIAIDNSELLIVINMIATAVPTMPRPASGPSANQPASRSRTGLRRRGKSNLTSSLVALPLLPAASTTRTIFPTRSGIKLTSDFAHLSEHLRNVRPIAFARPDFLNSQDPKRTSAVGRRDPF